MKAFGSALFLAGLLAALPATAAPKHVILSDSLLAHADRWEVKRGVQWMGIHKWRFGDYAVVTSKLKPTTTDTTTNLFKTKVERRSANAFMFVLCNKTTDSAFVAARQVVLARSQPGLKLDHGWSVGGEEGIHESDVFTASITINRDTSETWVLSIGSTEVSDRQGNYRDDLATHTEVLTHGDRRIALVPVFSKKRSQLKSFASQVALQFAPPALGYEFVEDGRSLCAVEYFSTGLAGQHRNTIWMHRNVDPRLQLVLAAAMTAVLQLKSVEGGPTQDDPE